MNTKNPNGAAKIALERQRQISKEGWTLEHDDEHGDGSLALAACCYAAPELLYVRRNYATMISFSDPWPWATCYDKRGAYGLNRPGEKNYGANFLPNPSAYNAEERIDLLVKAGALIAAEIDRLLRKADMEA